MSAPPSPPPRPKRLLCLHGRRTNDGVMKYQTAQLKRYLAKTEPFREVELVFANGPHAGPTPADPMVGQMFRGPYYEWWDSRQGAAGEYVYEGAAAALRGLVAVLRERGPFDGIVGFSQGAIVATVLTALRQAAGDAGAAPPGAGAGAGAGAAAGGGGDNGGGGAEQRMRAVPSLAPLAALLPELRAVPRWPLVLLFSGLVPRAAGWAAALWPAGEPLDVASVHVVSKEDFVFASGMELVQVFSERRPAPAVAAAAEGGGGGGGSGGGGAGATSTAAGDVWRAVVQHDQGHRFPTATAKVSGTELLFWEKTRDSVLDVLRVADAQ